MNRPLSQVVDRIRSMAAGLTHELKGGFHLAADLRSRLQFASDIFVSRLARHVPIPGVNGERVITVRGGLQIHYRLNRGDIQSIREVWIDECYRLPFDLAPTTLVDLGANIGLTSLWFAHRYGCKVIAVEPSPENARLVRLNLERNGIDFQILEGAVGPRDGTAHFQAEADSNLGHLGSEGRPVPVFSMDTVLGHLPAAQVDLVKLDIEGGEGPLLADNVGWLRRVKALIAEFHPDVIDYPAAIKSIESQGFRFIPAHSAVGFDSMDAFLRES